MTTYEPGFIGKATVRGVKDAGVMRGDSGWFSMAKIDGQRYHTRDVVTDVRPLTVIDPQDSPADIGRALSEAAGRTLVVLDLEAQPHFRESMVCGLANLRHNGCRDARHWVADQIEAQTKPTVAEPLGLGAVVEGREGNCWVRTNETSGLPWRKVGAEGRVSAWDGITGAYGPVAILSEGVAS